jgi:hypothetical protein
MKIAPPEYDHLYRNVAEYIGPNRKPTLIGFDGAGAAGKSSAASWLAWQLGIPTIHLDLFLARPIDEGPIEWCIEDLARCIDARSSHRCLIVEGVLLLDALSKITTRKIGYLIFVECKQSQIAQAISIESRVSDPREFSLENQVTAYCRRRNSKALAHFNLSWQEP